MELKESKAYASAIHKEVGNQRSEMATYRINMKDEYVETKRAIRHRNRRILRSAIAAGTKKLAEMRAAEEEDAEGEEEETEEEEEDAPMEDVQGLGEKE